MIQCPTIKFSEITDYVADERCTNTYRLMRHGYYFIFQYKSPKNMRPDRCYEHMTQYVIDVQAQYSLKQLFILTINSPMTFRSLSKPLKRSMQLSPHCVNVCQDLPIGQANSSRRFLEIVKKNNKVIKHLVLRSIDTFI